MKIIYSLIFSLIGVSLYSQTFQQEIQNAGKLYQEKKYEASAKAYSKAFEMKEGNVGQYYNASCSWALSGDTVQAMKFLNLSADKGWKNIRHIKRDKDLETLRRLHGWKSVLQKVQANLDEYEKDFDKPLKEQLEAIYTKDQTIRMLMNEAVDKFGRDSEEMDYFWSVIARQDSLNEIEVIDIIEKRGWVGISLVGGRANAALWLVIQHANIDLQEKYLPLLKESVLKKESTPHHLAMLEDRINMRRGKPQVYGSQMELDKETGKWKFAPIKDPEYVNQRRKEIGMGPIENSARRAGIEWTIEQKQR